MRDKAAVNRKKLMGKKICIYEINMKSLTMSNQAMAYVAPFVSIFPSQKFLQIIYLSYLVMIYLITKLKDCFFLIMNGSYSRFLKMYLLAFMLNLEVTGLKKLFLVLLPAMIPFQSKK